MNFSDDGYKSLIGSLGDPARDKAAGGYYAPDLLSDEQLIGAYRCSWVAKKLVSIPAFDAVRKWRDWQADTKTVDKIQAEEKRLALQGKLLECKVKARLWGGAGIFIGTGEEALEEPFDPERVKAGGLKYITVLSRRDLIAGELDDDPLSENFAKPKWFDVAGTKDFVRLHPSRIVVQIGDIHPDNWSAGGNAYGWGDSVLQTAFDSVRNADSAAANIASLIFEANIDVFGVPGFMANLVDPKYEERVLERFKLAAAGKSINRTLIHDADETYDRKAVTFAQLPELMREFVLLAAGAADIPLTRFIGQSPAGMSSTGDGDMKNYHDKIQSIQNLEFTPAMWKFDDALVRSAIGSNSDEIVSEWSPLEQMSEKEIADIADKMTSAFEKMSRVNAWSQEEIRTVGTAVLSEVGGFTGLDTAVAETDAAGGFDFGEEDDDPPVVDPELAGDAIPRTLYVRRDVLNADEILAWAKSQGLTELTNPADLHATIAHSRNKVDWMKIGQAWEAEMTVKEGGPRLVERFSPGAIVLLFTSHELEWRHEDMKNAGATWDWPDYQPHITLTFNDEDVDIEKIDPYLGEIRFGPEIFEELDENR